MVGVLEQNAVYFQGQSCRAIRVVLTIGDTNRMKPHTEAAFEEILRSLTHINGQALARKAELAASLAGLYPQCRQQLLKIERCARAQFEAIRGLRFGSAAAMD
jgi:hypothetical protein